MHFTSYFVDPLLRAPTLGSMLMGIASSLVGVVLVLNKRSLLGEALSHAAYPGVVLGVAALATFFPKLDELMGIAILLGAFLSAWAGLWLIGWMQRRGGVASDAALCFVLASFFGVASLLGSHMQHVLPVWYRQIQSFLYGQAATMTDIHILIYGVLALLIIGIFTLFYRPIEAMLFDRSFAKSVGVRVVRMERLLSALLILSVVVGIRSVGVVLMSGMLIAPAVAARAWTHRLSVLLCLSSCFGAVSAFVGNVLSNELPRWTSQTSSLPTGPVILLSAVILCLLSLCLSPRGGVLFRYVRMWRFRLQCRVENILKALWRQGEGALLHRAELAEEGASLSLRWSLARLTWCGWLERGERNRYRLTEVGRQRASRIVRLHRLWEVYLVHLGHSADRVHRSAEEMEHILTPELESKLVHLLADPTEDPHAQPIPRTEI